jgi:alpha-beta hydrolase superfamily lysophospholipase
MAVVKTARAGRLLVAGMLVVLAACGGKSPGAPDEQTGKVREQNVSFKTSDGVRLTGRLFGSSRVGLTLAHMYPADATSWYPFARKLAGAGYMALAFNFRGYASSEGQKNIPKTVVDIAAAKQFLRRSGAKDVAFVGASMGGTASIAAAETEDPMAVVAVSAPLRFMGLDAVPSTPHVQRPVLLMAAHDDASGAFDALQQFARDLPTAVTKVYAGDAHGTNLLGARPGAVDEIIAFLRRWAPVNAPTSTP